MIQQADKKKNGYGKGTFVEASIFLSPAWFSLGQKGTSPKTSTVSAQVLMLFLGKRQFATAKDKKGQKVKQRTDENRFHLTYAELSSLGIAAGQATRAIDELLAKGFIEILHPGGAFEKDKAIYGLSDDFRSWRPGTPPIRTRQRDIRRGYQGAGKGAAKQKLHASTRDTHTHANEGHPKQRHTRQRGTPSQQPK